jgi:hypothetical protein
MSKKDFQIIAQVLNDAGASYAICLHMARSLAAENAAFKTHVFLAACGHPR